MSFLRQTTQGGSMRSLILLVFVLMLASITGYSQNQTPASQATATISGKVLVSGKAVRGIKVVAIFIKPEGFNDKPAAFNLTDEEGSYHLQGLAAGSYSVKVDHISLTAKPKAKAAKDKQTTDNADPDEDDIDED